MRPPTAEVPPHIRANPRLGTWLSVADGRIVVHVGKVELGQGILTALRQIAADALGVPVDSLGMRAAHTALGPDEGGTSGSLSVLQAGAALRHLGGVVRALAGPVDEGYAGRVAALAADTDLCAVPPAPALPPVSVGRDEPRVDLADKVLGRPRFIADLRPPGLLFGRVLRPPSPAAQLAALPADWSSPGVRLVRDGSFLGLVGEREDDVDRGLAALRSAAAWEEHDSLPDEDDLETYLRTGPHEIVEVITDEPVTSHQPSTRTMTHTVTHTASYSKPFHAHASVAPSCGVAHWRDDGTLHVWSHSQAIHALRDAVAAALALDVALVSVEHVENAGCYGHNAADDAAFDAVLLARAVPGRPVQVRWTRADELTWSPLSSAMTATVAATLREGRIVSWEYDVWSQGHTARPGYRGVPGLLAGAHLAEPQPLPAAGDPPLANGAGLARNAIPAYDVGRRRITGHRKAETPLRTSAMRALGAYLNVFAIESFIDELAAGAGIDPVELRLAHLADPRAREVVRLAAERGGLAERVPEGLGRGLGFARYKDKGAYCAVVAEVAVDHDLRVRRLTVAADLGLVVSPDGARNQLEGGAVQSTSWTVRERVRFDRRRITSSDWESYPVLRFTEVPSVDVHLVASTEPSLGAGEAAQGPTAAAIANAVHAALGVRVRHLPIDSAAIVRAIEEEP